MARITISSDHGDVVDVIDHVSSKMAHSDEGRQEILRELEHAVDLASDKDDAYLREDEEFIANGDCGYCDREFGLLYRNPISPLVGAHVCPSCRDELLRTHANSEKH